MENADDKSKEMNCNIQMKQKYFKWVCPKCGWGAKGYDENAILESKKHHDALGCTEFASFMESKADRIK